LLRTEQQQEETKRQRNGDEITRIVKTVAAYINNNRPIWSTREQLEVHKVVMFCLFRCCVMS